jgi:hypothetical protein
MGAVSGKSRRFIMSQNINLKELERKAWTSYFQDGLWDIFLGLLLLAMAISALLSDVGFSESLGMAIFIGVEVLAMLVLWAGKRFITAPRMGRVKFGPKRKAKLNWVGVVLLLSVLVGAGVFVAGLAIRGNRPEWLNAAFFAPAAWVVNAIVVFSLGAYFLDFNRLYLIGVLYALSVPLDIMFHEFANVDLSFIAFGVPAIVILIIGLVVFTRFLRDYPIPAGAVSDGNH